MALTETEIDRLTKCEGKQRFRGYSEASKAIRHGSLLRPYKCQHCGMWHIGHKRRKK